MTKRMLHHIIIIQDLKATGSVFVVTYTFVLVVLAQALWIRLLILKFAPQNNCTVIFAENALTPKPYFPTTVFGETYTPFMKI